METKQYWKDKLTKTLVYAGIAYICTLMLFWFLLSETEQSPFLSLLLALFYSGIPSGWSITKKVFGGVAIIGFWGIMLIIIRVMLSLVIGIFALPIQILIYATKYKSAPDNVEAEAEDAVAQS